MNGKLLSDLIEFFGVSFVFIVIIFIFFSIFSKKFKFNEKNIEIYGLFLDLDTKSLISIASLTINYLFLIWCTISFSGLNIIYVAIIFMLVMISDIVLDDFKKMFIDIGLNIINCAAIQLIYIIYRHLTTEYFSYILLLTLFLLVMFVFLYITYNFFRQINNVVVNHKDLKNKKYKL